VRLKETRAEIASDTETVMANGLRMRPTTPSISSSGMNAAMSDAVIDTTVKKTSFAPFRAAAWGESPASM
jgi:hypothetical protein